MTVFEFFLMRFLIKKPKITRCIYYFIMDSEIASLHKILKDKTRRSIILLLHERGSLSYVNLMEEIGVTNTGTMNYHLKVIGDLILKKKDDGQYELTEKGRRASRLLLEGPEENRQQIGIKPNWWRKFWLESSVVVAVLLIAVLIVYFSGYMNSDWVYQSILAIISGVAFSYMIHHVLRNVLPKRTQLKVAKAVWIGVGACIGWVLSFFGTVFIILLGGPNLLHVLGYWWFVLVFLIAPFMGVPIGYWIGKRRHFRTAHYIPDS